MQSRGFIVRSVGDLLRLEVFMQDEEIEKLAEKIAGMISTGSKKVDISVIQKSVNSLDSRLAKLEAFSVQQPPYCIPYPIHPSQERFDIAEAIADEVFANYGKEKACTFEPNDKPCDHCAMCSSRGF